MTCETKAEGRTTPHRQKLAFSSCRQFLDTVMTNTVFFLPKIITEMPSTWPRKCFFFFSFFLSYLNVLNPEFGIGSSGFIPIY
jgi:hypothetical protein